MAIQLFVMIELRELCPAVATTQVYSAARFQDAYYAVGDTIYKKTHLLAEWARPGFAVNRIEINGTGELVALSGESEVAIYSSDGVFQRGEVFSKGILKTLWHPLGVDDACLVVLSQGHIRNLCLGPTEYFTDTFDFTKSPVGAQDSPQFANSMTFGPANATGEFTLYLSTDEGNVFALAPFLPPKFQIKTTRYSQLLDYAVTAFFSNEGTPQESLYGAQLDWVTSLESQILDPVLKYGEHFYVLEAPDPGMLRSQGPFKVMPYPDQLYECDFTDIASLSYGKLHFLVQAATNSVVFLQIEEPTPVCWDYSGPGDYDPTLTLVQLLTKVPTPSRLEITKSLVWGHTPTSTVLYEPTWLPTLEKNLEATRYTKLERAKHRVLPLSVVYTNPISATADSVTDSSDSTTCYYVPTSKSGAPALAAPPLAPTAVDLPPESSYFYHNSAMDDLHTLIDSVSLYPSKPVAGLLEDSSKSLAKLDALANAYTRENNKVYKCLDLAFEAMQLQQGEHRRQLEAAEDIRKAIAGIDTDQQQKRIAKVLKRQQDLLERFAAVEAVANKSYAPAQPIGQLERRWFQELKEQRDTVAQFESRKDSVAKDLETVDASAPYEMSSRKVQELRVVLFRLQRLGRDISQMDRIVKEVGDEIKTVESEAH